jgi:hypothetical protein
MPIRNPQTELDRLYAARDNLLANSIQEYKMEDGRSFTLFNLEVLNREIRRLEAVVVASECGPIVADFSRW